MNEKFVNLLKTLALWGDKSQKIMFLHIFCNIKRPYSILFGLYLGGIVVT
jgi:hypothetical protein